MVEWSFNVFGFSYLVAKLKNEGEGRDLIKHVTLNYFADTTVHGETAIVVKCPVGP